MIMDYRPVGTDQERVIERMMHIDVDGENQLGTYFANKSTRFPLYGPSYSVHSATILMISMSVRLY